MRTQIACVLPAALLLSCALIVRADTITLQNHTFSRYEWRASTCTASAQHQATLTVCPHGDIVAVWSSRRQHQGRSGVYAQRFTPQGVAIGTETPVGLHRRAHQTNPAVTADSQGNVWIVWESFGQDAQAGAIIARCFDDAFRGGPEICVNQDWRGHQAAPVVAVSDQGRALVVWTSTESPYEPARLRARLLGPNGQPLGDELAVSSVANRNERTPSVAFSRDGGFAVAFSVFDTHGDPAGIRLQRFDDLGHHLGSEIEVSVADKPNSIEPTVAATSDGFIVAWHDAVSDGDDYGVLARRFDSAGRPLGAPFVVNTTRGGLQNAAAVATAPDGCFAVAWNSDDGDKTGVCAQLFAADGRRVGEQHQLSRHSEGKQAMQVARGTGRLAFAADGSLLCVWSGDGGFGDESSVNVTMLAPRPLMLARQTQGVTNRMPIAMPAAGDAGAAKPHEPPTFDRELISAAEREIREETPYGFTGSSGTGWNPPDPHLAVGPGNIVIMVNGKIAILNLGGTELFADEIDGPAGFWGDLGATGFVFDPEVIYDEISGRYFAMATEAVGYPSGTESKVLIAVSDDSDAEGTWYKYRLDTSSLAGDLFDSPNISVDNEAVYITGDGFGLGANYPIFIYDKASLLAGAPPATVNSLLLPTSTQSAGIPPVSYDDPPALYMIEHEEGNNRTHVRLIALQDPLGTPSYTTYSLTVPAYSAPANPPQKGTTARPELFDARFWSVAYRGGSLWATHHINSRAVARWYEIAMNGWPDSGIDPVLVQSGDVDFGGDYHTYFTAIGVNVAGDAALTFSRSSPNQYISMMTVYRMAEDAPGTYRGVRVERISTTPDQSERWGDYAAVQPEPGNPYRFWAHHEYITGLSWTTWIARVSLLKRVGDLNCDGFVDFGDINPFVLVLVDPDTYVATYPDCSRLLADIDGDGEVDFGDINPFVDLLLD